MGTQVPKGLGIGVMLVGVPLILWSASNTNDELNAFDAESSSPTSRVEACAAGIWAKTGHLGIPPAEYRDMCGCVVDKADERGVTASYGSYDEAGLEKVVESCAWQLGL